MSQTEPLSGERGKQAKLAEEGNSEMDANNNYRQIEELKSEMKYLTIKTSSLESSLKEKSVDLAYLALENSKQITKNKELVAKLFLMSEEMNNRKMIPTTSEGTRI